MDSGDTLIDEGSEIRVDGVVQDARPIPGALELVTALKEQGNLVALVADGSQESFDNVHGKLGLTPLFDVHALYPALWVSRNRTEECSIQRQNSWGWYRKTITESFISETIFVATSQVRMRSE